MINTSNINTTRLINEGYMLLNQRMYDNAIKHFLSVLSFEPKNVEALVGLASAYQYTNKIEAALKTAFIALEIDPEFYYTYIILSEIYFINKHDYFKAEEYALKSLEFNPFNSAAYSLLAQIYLFQKKYSDCYQQAHRSLELDPENYVAHMVIGLYYFHTSNFNKAEEHYKKSLEIAPNSSTVFCNYGLLNLAYAKNTIGYKLLREAVKLKPEDKYLQDALREAFIRNSVLYSPLSKLTNGKLDDVYILYSTILAVMIISFLYNIPIIPIIFKKILILLFLLNAFLVIIMVIYRLIMRSLINQFYSWAVKSGNLSKYI